MVTFCNSLWNQVYILVLNNEGPFTLLVRTQLQKIYKGCAGRHANVWFFFSTHWILWSNFDFLHQPQHSSLFILFGPFMIPDKWRCSPRMEWFYLLLNPTPIGDKLSVSLWYMIYNLATIYCIYNLFSLMLRTYWAEIKVEKEKNHEKILGDLTCFISVWLLYCPKLPEPFHALCVGMCTCTHMNLNNQLGRPNLSYTKDFVKILLHLTVILRCISR